MESKLDTLAGVGGPAGFDPPQGVAARITLLTWVFAVRPARRPGGRRSATLRLTPTSPTLRPGDPRAARTEARGPELSRKSQTDAHSGEGGTLAAVDAPGRIRAPLGTRLDKQGPQSQNRPHRSEGGPQNPENLRRRAVTHQLARSGQRAREIRAPPARTGPPRPPCWLMS